MLFRLQALCLQDIRLFLSGYSIWFGRDAIVPQMEIITPSNMEAYRSLLVVVWVAVGGRGTLSGAVLGALVVNLLYNYFTSQHDFYLFSWNPDYWQILLGLMFVLVVLYLPNGLIGVLDKLRGTIDFKERKTRS